MDRRDSLQSDASSMWQQCVSYISQSFGSSQRHESNGYCRQWCVTCYSAPAYWGEATDPANAVVRPPVDQPVQVQDSLTKTVPKARIIPNRIVMSTSGAQHDRWKQATQKEQQAFLKTAWKEPTPELRSRYFASKKKVVM